MFLPFSCNWMPSTDSLIPNCFKHPPMVVLLYVPRGCSWEYKPHKWTKHFSKLQLKNVPTVKNHTWLVKCIAKRYSENISGPSLQYGRPWFDRWVRKICWRRTRQPTPVFCLEEYHGQRSLVGYSPQGHKESVMTEATEHAHIHICSSHNHDSFQIQSSVKSLHTAGFSMHGRTSWVRTL